MVAPRPWAKGLPGATRETGLPALGANLVSLVADAPRFVHTRGVYA